MNPMQNMKNTNDVVPFCLLLQLQAVKQMANLLNSGNHAEFSEMSWLDRTLLMVNKRLSQKISYLLPFEKCLFVSQIIREVRLSFWWNSDLFCAQKSARYNVFMRRNDVIWYEKPVAKTLATSFISYCSSTKINGKRNSFHYDRTFIYKLSLI